MGIWGVLSGRTKPPRNNLDQLFGIPSAAITLAAAMDLQPTGIGAVCYRAAQGPAFADAEAQMVEFLDSDEGPDVERVPDSFGFTWLVVRTDPVDVTSLVTDLHAVNTSIEAAGFATGLLCSVVGFSRPGAPTAVGLVYRYKSGTFYPFAQTGPQQRDPLLEMQVRTQLARELPIEEQTANWMPIWDCPAL